MQECCTCGSVRGALGNQRPYRDKRRNKEKERKKRQNERKDLTLTGLLMVNRPI
jgi:hypothetical protein